MPRKAKVPKHEHSASPMIWNIKKQRLEPAPVQKRHASPVQPTEPAVKPERIPPSDSLGHPIDWYPPTPEQIMKDDPKTESFPAGAISQKREVPEAYGDVPAYVGCIEGSGEVRGILLAINGSPAQVVPILIEKYATSPKSLALVRSGDLLHLGCPKGNGMYRTYPDIKTFLATTADVPFAYLFNWETEKWSVRCWGGDLVQVAGTFDADRCSNCWMAISYRGHGECSCSKDWLFRWMNGGQSVAWDKISDEHSAPEERKPSRWDLL